MKKIAFLFFIQIANYTCNVCAQNTWSGLKCSGVNIVDKNNQVVLLKGYAPGEWLNIEAYEFKYGAKLGQTAYYYKLIEMMGESNADEYLRRWQKNIITEEDIRQMSLWGVNSIRLPMNYRHLSSADGVYKEKGFSQIDSLIQWSKKYNVYVILDMHSAPGAQSTGVLSDCIDGIARLWDEPAKYQPWCINLWKYIAQRYANEPTVAGYDLLNEPDADYGVLKEFYIKLTSAIRMVDKNHILFVEGRSGGDVAPLSSSWDSNLCWSFHKYWNWNDYESIRYHIDFRNSTNCPLWMGEAGENTDTWAKEMVTLLESNNIGWNWWTTKKVTSNNCPFSIPAPFGYEKIQSYLAEKGEKPTPTEASTILFNLADNAASSKCIRNDWHIKALFGEGAILSPSQNNYKQINSFKTEGNIRWGFWTYTTTPTLGWVASGSNTANLDKLFNSNNGEEAWQSGTNMQPGQWVSVDMVQKYPVSRIDVETTPSYSGEPFYGSPVSYDLYFSNDGIDWGNPVASGAGSCYISITFPTQNKRYFKIVQTGTASTPWRVHEIAVLQLTSPPVPLSTVSILPTQFTINSCDNKLLTPTFTPVDATNQSVSWKSSNTTVATVDANGLVKGVGPGTAAITVTTVEGNKTASSSVTVTACTIPQNLALNKPYATASVNYNSVENAFDGNLANNTDNKNTWGATGKIATDLGAKARITSVNIVFKDVTAYQLAGSDDGITWTNIGSKVTSPSNPNSTLLSGISFRYIRVEFDPFNASGNYYNPQIKEIEVFGFYETVTGIQADVFALPSQLLVHPNPVEGGNNISVTILRQSEPVLITFHEVTGKLLYTRVLGKNEIMLLPLEGLKNGLYMIKAVGGEFQQSQKIVVK